MDLQWQSLPVYNASDSCLSSSAFNNFTFTSPGSYCAYKVPSYVIAQICCTYLVQQVQDECTYMCANSDPPELRLCLSSALGISPVNNTLQIQCYHNFSSVSTNHGSSNARNSSSAHSGLSMMGANTCGFQTEVFDLARSSGCSRPVHHLRSLILLAIFVITLQYG